MIKTTRGLTASLMALGLALALVATACGSSDNATSSTESSSVKSTTTVALTGEPVKVMLISQLEAPGFAFPEIEPITKAAIDQFNAVSGVQGRPVELIVCNDKYDSNVAAGCARDAVSQNVAAVLGYFSFGGDAVLPILQAAGIPYIGNSILGISDAGNPAAFPLEGGIVSIGAEVGRALVKAGCKGVGAVGDGSVAASLYSNYAKIGVEASGGKWVGNVETKAGTPDYGPSVASLVSKEADCIHSPLPPAESSKLLGAVEQSGEKLRVGSGAANVPEDVIQKLPASSSDGTIIVTPLPVATDLAFPGVEDYVTHMKDAGVPEATINAGFALSSYAKTVVALHALSSIQGEINAASMTKAMSNITDPGTPLLGTFTTTKESAMPGFNRVFNLKVLVYGVKDQKLVRQTETYVDTSDLLAPAR
jgi:ABC-type branched-subunit amino acid transport system substrate-binding protein